MRCETSYCPPQSRVDLYLKSRADLYEMCKYGVRGARDKSTLGHEQGGKGRHEESSKHGRGARDKSTFGHEQGGTGRHEESSSNADHGSTHDQARTQPVDAIAAALDTGTRGHDHSSSGHEPVDTSRASVGTER